MHIITLSFDDGLCQSTLKTAEIFEDHGLSACFNVVAKGENPTWQTKSPVGDFALWNQLQSRGHEIMPHGYRHANKSLLALEESKTLIGDCLDVFRENLEGFEPARCVFHFPYNAATPELEAWLLTQVRAYRVGGNPINAMPHRGQQKLTTTGQGPGNCEAHLDGCIAQCLAESQGWLIYTLHGLDDEGWGPIGSDYLARLLDRLALIKSVQVLTITAALDLSHS